MKKGQGLSRRDFLKLSGMVGAGTLLGGALPAFARQDTNLLMWWWGEQELPGLQRFVDVSIAAYKDAKIDAVLQDTSVVISQFQTASAANAAPDIQYLWNGIYHMESVWLGYLEPLNGLVSAEVLKDSTATLLSNFDGNQYRVGWYPLPMVWYYNKELFDKAKLDADKPPKTWDELLSACDKLKSAGIAPVGGGIQDGFWGEWYMGHGLVQNLDKVGEAIDLFTGVTDFREPKYHEFWGKLEELVKAGFTNSEFSSLELYPGIDLIVAGKVAMGESIGARVPADNKTLNGNLGVMVMPVYGKGALAGKPILDVQGLGISSQSKNKEAAARFLEYLHSPERLKAFWDTTSWMPSNSKWDSSVIQDPVVKYMWENWNLGDNIPYISNVVPGQFYTDALLPNAQEIIAGTRTGEEAGEVAWRVAKEWRDFNPDLLEKYQKWSEDLSK